MLPGGLPEQKVRADRAVVMRSAVQRTSGGHLIANLSLACHKGDAGRVDLPGRTLPSLSRTLTSVLPLIFWLRSGSSKGPGDTRVWYRMRPFWLTVTCALLFAMPLIFGAYP